MTYIPTNKELISLEQWLELIKKYHAKNEHFDDIPEYPLVRTYLEEIEKDTRALPTFSPEAIIEEMIEKLKNTQFLAMIDKKIEENLYEEVHTIDVLRKFRSDVEKMEDNTVSKKDALSFAYWYHN